MKPMKPRKMIYLRLKNSLFLSITNRKVSFSVIRSFDEYLLLYKINRSAKANKTIAEKKNRKKIIVMIENSSNNPKTITGTKDHRILAEIIRRKFLFCII